MKNEINSLKFTDEVEYDNDIEKQIPQTNCFVREINESLDLLETEKDPEKRVSLQENIIDQIYCCYVEAMRWDLIYGTTSKKCMKELTDLQDRMFTLSSRTGNEFLKLQTGFLNILVEYINKNS